MSNGRGTGDDKGDGQTGLLFQSLRRKSMRVQGGVGTVGGGGEMWGGVVGRGKGRWGGGGGGGGGGGVGAGAR